MLTAARPGLGRRRVRRRRPARVATGFKRVEAAVMREVAEELGNTPAVARGSYVDPRVVTGYEQGLTIAAAVRRAERARRPEAAQEILERATRMLIRRLAKGNSSSGQPALAKSA
jgi:DNA topoisomerase I